MNVFCGDKDRPARADLLDAASNLPVPGRFDLGLRLGLDGRKKVLRKARPVFRGKRLSAPRKLVNQCGHGVL